MRSSYESVVLRRSLGEKDYTLSKGESTTQMGTFYKAILSSFFTITKELGTDGYIYSNKYEER